MSLVAGRQESELLCSEAGQDDLHSLHNSIAKPKQEAEGTAGWTGGTARRVLAW